MSTEGTILYYNPEKFHLTPVGEIEWGSGHYEFDLTVVWQHEDGTFYWAEDSGCSCPTPFEEFTKVADLNPLTSLSEFANHLDDKMLNLHHSYKESYGDQYAPQVVALIEKLHALGAR
jgi:hypothetical protein